MNKVVEKEKEEKEYLDKMNYNSNSDKLNDYMKIYSKDNFTKLAYIMMLVSFLVILFHILIDRKNTFAFKKFT
jgi:hypothetical protein